MQKRQLDSGDEQDPAAGGDNKKYKYDGTMVAVGSSSMAVALSSQGARGGGAVPERLSSLMAPEVTLTGHEGAVFSLSFDPTGKYMCSGSYDKSIRK
jgi:WD40 repeat protein